MGVFPCAWPSPKMGNISVPGVRSLLSIWNSLPTFPISFRRYVHNKADGAEEEGKDELGKEGPRSLTVAPRNFYINQCRVLEEQLSFAEEMSNQIISRDVTDLLPSANLLWPKSALTELRRVLSVGKSLIQECHNEPCLKAYLKQGERAQAFVETLKEIVWCMSVVFYYNNIKGSLKENPNLMANDQFPFVKLGAYKELHMLQKAALADQAELVTSLNIWIQNHYGVCSAKECGARPEDEGKVPPFCIAAQILGRRAKIDSAAIEGASEVDHTSVLWNINSHVLEDGAHVGAGSFCSVVETRWLGDTYARKIFQVYHPEIFKNEANALSKLSHRHMVTVSAYSVDLHTCSLLMERMKYDLRKYMKYKSSLGVYSPFSFPAAIDLMLQVAESLRYMHSQKMVHRDVKPANILVEEVDDPELRKEGFVIAKLADFGLAKCKREVTEHTLT
ncbi:hypothetical protein M758_5G077500 [Ceratodon purpureus]|nr:hypothetical protein M758_5G077500 [Ceratodon purpureus]